MRSFLLLWGTLFIFVLSVKAQFVPIPVTGFTQDVIAEGGPSSLATTSAALDAAGSNKIMYSTAFASFAGITAGLPANGTLVSGADTYQLANFNGNNSVFVFQGQSSELTLTSPASYARLRVVCFSTEGPSTVNISVTFTDNTTVNYISNYNLPDWFYGSANIIVQGFGRCSRTATGPWTPDGLPSNPKIYFIDIPLSCADILKQVQKITVSNVSTGGNAPFPNTVLLGLSGTAYSRNIVPVITPADCSGNNGSISLTVTGSGSPYSYVWNTNPVQTGPTATGLVPGTYTTTITDAFGCTSTYTGTVPFNNNSSLSATANPMTICNGESAQLSATVLSGPLTSFTWNPGNLSGQTVTVNPTVSTFYTVTGTNALGCITNAQVWVMVNPVPAPPLVNGNPAICQGSTANLWVINPQSGFIYEWYNAPVGGNLLFTGISFTTPPLNTPTTFYVETVSAQGCRSARVPFQVNITPSVIPATASSVVVCPNTNVVLTVQNPQPLYSYRWIDNATSVILSYTSTCTINNVMTNMSIQLVTISPCMEVANTLVTVTLIPPLPAPVASLSNITQSSLMFSWDAVPGATGYQVSVNGGATFQTPSSGTNGTTHTISGLALNSTIDFQVRALGVVTCETSILSVPVKGTTLSTKEVFVPNVFTPNGDGKNDLLKVYGNYVASIQLRIFNQWGQLIFYSDNISQGWDGNFKGQQQPVGVYAYTLKATLNDNTVINKKGSINLIR